MAVAQKKALVRGVKKIALYSSWPWYWSVDGSVLKLEFVVMLVP